MLDINKIQSVRSIAIEIKHPVTDEGLGAFVTILSNEHPDRRNALRDYNRILRNIGDGESPDHIAQRTDAHVQFAASCITGWEGITEDEQPIEFSNAAARTLLAKQELDWLLGQLSLALIDQKNFIAAQPKA